MNFRGLERYSGPWRGPERWGRWLFFAVVAVGAQAMQVLSREGQKTWRRADIFGKRGYKGNFSQSR